MGKVNGQGIDVAVSMTRPANTTAYSANDVCGTDPATNMVFSNVSSFKGGKHSGGDIIIVGASLKIDVNAVPSGMSGFRLHLYKAAPTAIADNSAYNLATTDTGYIGNIELDTPIDLGSALWSRKDNQNIKVSLAEGSNTIYGILETIGAYTPSSAAVKTVTIYVLEV